MFDALANEHRREIIMALALQPRSISQLANLRDLSLPAIHKHVRVLENAAMVQRRKIGRTNFLALERAPLRGLTTWVDQFHPWWGTGEESLETYAAYLARQPATTEESS
ncbi:MAG: winged helix-turn-helix domain-containing protein [Actinomycetota bacterium]|nr:winged helix-turn-helix domain-containing protein [Actinomycetota bacterium]